MEQNISDAVANVKAVFTAGFYGTGDEGDIVDSEVEYAGEVIEGTEFFVGNLKTADTGLLEELASEIFGQEGVSYDGDGGGGVVSIPIGIGAPLADQEPTTVIRYWLGQGETHDVAPVFSKELVPYIFRHEALLRKMATAEVSASFNYSGCGDDGGIEEGDFSNNDGRFTDEEYDALSGLAGHLVESSVPGFELDEGSCGTIALIPDKLIEALDALKLADGSIPKLQDIEERGRLANFANGVTMTYCAYGVESERDVVTLPPERVVKMFESVLAIDEARKARKAKALRP